MLFHVVLKLREKENVKRSWVRRIVETDAQAAIDAAYAADPWSDEIEAVAFSTRPVQARPFAQGGHVCEDCGLLWTDSEASGMAATCPCGGKLKQAPAVAPK